MCLKTYNQSLKELEKIFSKVQQRISSKIRLIFTTSLTDSVITSIERQDGTYQQKDKTRQDSTTQHRMGTMQDTLPSVENPPQDKSTDSDIDQEFLSVKEDNKNAL